MAYNIYYNDKSSKDVGIEVVKRPFIPFPKKIIKEKQVDGRNGSYYIDNGTYEDMIITIEFNFVEDNVDDIRRVVRDIKHYFDDKIDNRLFLSDDLDTYFKVKKVEMEDISYEEFYEIQSFSVDFTVEAYEYVLLGQNEMQVTNQLYNHYDLSRPIYKIVGSGNCYLTVNGTKVLCKSISNYITINTENDKILDSSGNFLVGKTNIYHMQDLYLQHGLNNITVTNGFKLYITPNYRTI